MKRPWLIQWHVAADGTVIKQRSRGNDPNQQLYSRYPMARKPELSQLYAMEEKLRSDSAYFTRLTRVMLYVFYLAGAALVAGLILMTFVDGTSSWSVILVVAAVVVCCGLALAIMPVHRAMNTRFQSRWREAGFDGPAPVTMGASEARQLIAAPGTESGSQLSVERA